MNSQKQQGAALVVAMVMLLLLTILGTDSMQSSVLNMHLTKGFRDHDFAFQSAETGLRFAEAVLENSDSVSAAETNLSTAEISFSTGTPDLDSAAFWDGVNRYSNEHPVKVVVEHWRFIPDSLVVGDGSTAGLSYYRITARGVDPGYNKYLSGGSSEDYALSRASVYLQSIYAVRHAY